MAATIWLILFSILIWFIWFVIGKFTERDDIEWMKRDLDNLRWDYEALAKFNDLLKHNNQRFMKYVPTTEIKKELILELHRKGMKWQQIANIVWVKKSAINTALRKWGIRQK